jgi:hypothetical protein
MEENTNGKFLYRRVNFSPVSNFALQDERLSLKAKGLYALIQCYNGKPNFDLYKRTLIKLCKEGVKAFDSAWKELKNAGYLKIYRVPSGTNDRFEYEYELLDEPNDSIPSLINLNKKRELIPPKQQNLIQEKKSAPKNPHTPPKGVYANSESAISPQPNTHSDEIYVNSHTPHFAPYAKWG